LCGCASDEASIEYRNSTWNENQLFNNLKIYFCNKCGLGSAFPVPEKNDLDNFYENDYRAKSSPFYINFSHIIRPFKRAYRSFAQLKLALRFTQLSEGDVFVDLGPGHGESFGEIIHIFGPNYLDCWAIEYSSNAAEYYHHYTLRERTFFNHYFYYFLFIGLIIELV